MAKCDVCGEAVNMPYNCRHCGGTHCGSHRLPENHGCPGLENWNDPSGVFGSGFDSSINTGSSSGSIVDRLGIDTGPGSVFAYFRGNVTYLFLALMWATFLAQLIVLAIGGVSLHRTLFVLHSDNVLYVWTWITSIFAHSTVRISHIVFNSIVIFFFGPLVERYVGSKRFAVLFIAGGVIAGLSQTSITLLEGASSGVLGASGAALAIMGVLTVLNPHLKVYLYFLLPIPIWLLTVATVGISFFFIAAVSPGAGGIAHMAHLVGLAIGLAYGEYLKRTMHISPPSEFEFGGGQGRRRF